MALKIMMKLLALAIFALGLVGCQSTSITAFKFSPSFHDSQCHHDQVAHAIDSVAPGLGFADKTELMRRNSPESNWIRAYTKPLGRMNGVRIWARGGKFFDVIVDQLGTKPSQDFITSTRLLELEFRKIDPQVDVDSEVQPFFF